MLVPLADCLNHNPQSSVSIELVEKNLHRQMNKIYLYKHNFEGEGVGAESTAIADTLAGEDDSIYDKSGHKLKIQCSKLFKEDEMEELPDALKSAWSQASQAPSGLTESGEKVYSRSLCH